jgi:hypothetical protein
MSVMIIPLHNRCLTDREIVMSLSNAERQTRWRVKRNAEHAELRKMAWKQADTLKEVTAECGRLLDELVEARAEIKRLRKQVRDVRPKAKREAAR